MSQLIAIDPALLQQVADAASASPRRRRHHNFHHRDDDACHRLLNAMATDSYIPPHCHADPAKDETIIALRGCFGVVEFGADGTVLRTLEIAPDGNPGVTIPHGVWHTLVCLDAGVFFETKAGPYQPLSAAERVAWAPAEGAAEAAAWLERLRRLFRPTAADHPATVG